MVSDSYFRCDDINKMKYRYMWWDVYTVTYRFLFVYEQLYKAGYHHLDALDQSKCMLEEARKKNIYSQFFCEAVGSNRLPIDDGVLHDNIVTLLSLCERNP